LYGLFLVPRNSLGKPKAPSVGW